VEGTEGPKLLLNQSTSDLRHAIVMLELQSFYLFIYLFIILFPTSLQPVDLLGKANTPALFIHLYIYILIYLFIYLFIFNFISYVTAA